MKLNKATMEFLNYKPRAKATMKAYSADMQALNSWFGDIDMRDIKPVQLMDFTSKHASSPSSVSRMLRTYSSLWNYCSEVHGVPNVIKFVPKPKVQEKDFSSLITPEAIRFIKVAREDTPRNSFLCLLPLFCGLRVSELKNLTLQQVDADYIYEVEGKSKNSRTIPFPIVLQKDAVRFFKWRQLLDLSPTSPLFINDKGGKLNEKTIYRIINKNLVRAGVPIDRAHPHALRHTYAMLALKHIGEQEQNPSKALTDVSRLMGHAFISTTMKYIKPSKEELKKSIEGIKLNT